MGIRKDLAAKEWAKDSSACFPPDATKILPDEAILWIVKAGLTPELVTDQYDFCWSDTLQRVIIPVSPFSFVSRALDGRKPKYINKGEQVLYEAGRPRSVAVLVEDILSAIKVAEQGYYACASLGTALTESHIAQLITHNVKRVVIWYDPDAAGDAGASKAYNKLKYYGLDPVVIKSTYDPKLHSREYIVNLIEKGINHA